MSKNIRLVFVVALAVRVVLVLWLHYAPPQYRPTMPIFAADSAGYDALAKNLLAGKGYQIHGDFREYSRIPPLFSVFLAGLYALWGPSVIGTGLANALLGALTAVLLYDLARVCCGGQGGIAGRVALAAGLIFAFYPYEIFNTPYVLKENFSIFLTVAFALCWARVLEAAAPRERVRWGGAAGVLLGLSVLSRFVHAGLAPLFLLVNLWLIWRRRQAGLVKPTLIALGCCALTLAPWLVRNYNLFGQVMLSPHGPARYLFTANSHLAQPEMNGYFEGRGGTAAREKAIDAARPGDATAQEGAFAREAAASALRHPGHLVQLLGAKLVGMWRPVWQRSSTRAWLLLGVPYIAMMLCAVPGLWLAPRRFPLREHPALTVLYAMVAYYFVGHLVFYGMIRERQYVEPYLMVFAAVTLVNAAGAPLFMTMELTPVRINPGHRHVSLPSPFPLPAGGEPASFNRHREIILQCVRRLPSPVRWTPSPNSGRGTNGVIRRLYPSFKLGV